MDKEDENEKMITKCFEVEKPMDRGKCLIADQRQLRPKLAVGDLSRKLAVATDPRKAQMLQRPGIPEDGRQWNGAEQRDQATVYKKFCTPMFITVLFTSISSIIPPKGGRNPNIHWQIMHKQNVVLTYNGIFSTLIRKEMMTPATTWTYLEGIMLREIYQPQKGNYCLIPLHWGT